MYVGVLPACVYATNVQYPESRRGYENLWNWSDRPL